MGRYEEKIKMAAEIIKSSDALLIMSGAGIGVDSGLPDFRGDKGFWNAYPVYERLKLSFVNAANPAHFERDPAFGWGFYGHRLELYRKTTPHKGFYIMLNWIKKLKSDYFVVTSNVDGQFQKAGYPDDKIYEVHGSIHYLQCMNDCTNTIWENRETIDIDYKTMRAKNIPKCPFCGAVARPNILMFGDYSWIPNRSHKQSLNFDKFLHHNKDKRIAIVEIGAGDAVATIRNITENVAIKYSASVIRINLRQPSISKPHIGIGESALKALSDIDKYISAH